MAETFYDRLVVEKQQLDERIHKLEAFLASDKVNDIAPAQYSLLTIQVQAMNTYSKVLTCRISLLQTEPA